MANSGSPQVFSLLHLHWTFCSMNCPNGFPAQGLCTCVPQIHSFINIFKPQFKHQLPLATQPAFLHSTYNQLKIIYLKMAEVLMNSLIHSSDTAAREKWGDTIVKRLLPASTTHIMKIQDWTKWHNREDDHGVLRRKKLHLPRRILENFIKED